MTAAFRGSALLLGLIVAAFVPDGVAAAVDHPLDGLLWVASIAAANLLTVPMLPRVNVDTSLGTPVCVASAVVLSPPFALLVNFLGFTNERELRGQASPWASLFNRAQAALSAGVASWVVQDHSSIVVGTVIAAVVYNLVEIVAVASGVWTLGRLGLVRATRQTAAPFPRFAVDLGLVTLLALLVVIAYDTVGFWAIALLAMPLWLGYSALSSARESEDRAEELAVRVRELETLSALGTELLSARRVRQIAAIGVGALRVALDVDDVELSVEGDVTPGLHVVKILGAEPAAIGVPADLTERSLSVVEAVAGLLGMALQRIELEEELAEGQRARAALSGRILEEGTRERSRIALQIHDEVLPFLAAAEIQADNVRSALVAADDGTADRLAATTRDAVHDGIARLREVLEALRSQIVVPGGLRPALVKVLEDLRLKHGVDGFLCAPEVFSPLPLAVEILMLETVRGCLTNVAAHADATRVEVRVAVSAEAITATVTDDGCGFDPIAVPAGHHGLALMAKRVELARGRFDVTSAPGRGTTVKVEVPV